MYDIEPKIRAQSEQICPRDKQHGAAFVDVAPDPYAGRATVMLSYGWGYRVIDIVRALEAFCDRNALDPREVRVWICCLCINQHRVKEAQQRGDIVPFAEFEAAFGSRVRGIGRVLALLSPWNSPFYLTRVWCIYELFVADSTEGVTLELILPRREADAFTATFAAHGIQAVWDTVAAVKVENAQASVPSDRENIFALVRNGAGFARLNKVVVERVQQWFLEAGRAALRTMMAEAGAGPERANEV